jgi:alkylhydroperoxidase family enzyme
MNTKQRVTLTDPAEMTTDQRHVYDRFPSNLARALLLTKASAGPHFALGASFTTGLISFIDREALVMRVAKLLESEFERMIHYPLSLKAGLTESEIDDIEAGRFDNMDKKRRALIQYVSECTLEHKASAEAFWALREFYSQNEIAEITHLAGHAAMTAMYLASLDIPLDEHETSWGRLNELNGHKA